ncbi:MAG: DUF975 family protein [Bacteroidota bacterium]|nr:DUF975 family protein [Bacteroidota bacterium]
MYKENKTLMSEALDALEGRWGITIGTCLVFILIQSIFRFIPYLGFIIIIIIRGPLSIGLNRFLLSISRRQEAEIGMLFSEFNNFKRAFLAYLLLIVYILLYTLLLIVPGIIKAYSLSQTFFILADNPSIGYNEALKSSERMMQGNKLRYFYLHCRFIGWILLSLLTLGIGLIWLIPYIRISIAGFYDDLKENTIIDQPFTENL